MKPTLREIAVRARVHHSTASTILNGARGSTRVSEATRHRVIDAARELGYSVNRAAQQLKKQRSGVVGLLVGGLENPFFARLAALCTEALEREGYEVVLAARRADESSDLHLLEALISRQLDGILLWNETLTELHDRVGQSDMNRSVVLGLPIDGRDSVSGDLEQGVREALDHLYAQGRRRIAFLCPRVSIDRAGDPRYSVYVQRIRDWGLNSDVLAYDAPSYGFAAPRQSVQARFEQDSPPDALFCMNDNSAIAALMALGRSSVKVPDDVAIVGCDDLPLAAEMNVPLSSIAYPLKEMATSAVRLLLDRIAAEEQGRPPAQPCHVLLPTRLVVRESSMPVHRAAQALHGTREGVTLR